MTDTRSNPHGLGVSPWSYRVGERAVGDGRSAQCPVDAASTRSIGPGQSHCLRNRAKLMRSSAYRGCITRRTKCGHQQVWQQGRRGRQGRRLRRGRCPGLSPFPGITDCAPCSWLVSEPSPPSLFTGSMTRPKRPPVGGDKVLQRPE